MQAASQATVVGPVLFVGGVGTAKNDGEARTVIKLWVYAASCLLAPIAKDISRLPRDLMNNYQIPRLEWTISASSSSSMFHTAKGWALRSTPVKQRASTPKLRWEICTASSL